MKNKFKANLLASLFTLSGAAVMARVIASEAEYHRRMLALKWFGKELPAWPKPCVVRFTQGLEAGVNRISWGPDGALYIGGIGSTSRLFNSSTSSRRLAPAASSAARFRECRTPCMKTASWMLATAPR